MVDKVLNLLDRNATFWLTYGNLYINTYFFQRGLVIVSSHPNTENISETNKSFTINQREFFFYQPGGNTEKQFLPEAKALKKTTLLLRSLTSFAQKKESLLHLEDNPIVLFNKRRREEIFLPVILTTKDNIFGMYVYPWIAKNPSQAKEYDGFSQFVTAGCMFGASLQAVTDKGEEIELINHQIRLKENTSIVSIHYDSKLSNPFELVLFDELNRNCHLIKSLAQDRKTPQLFFHLPVFDYLLFGIKLYLNKQMAESALKDFVDLVWQRKKVYEEKIYEICTGHGIEVIIASPFDNLFEKLSEGTPYLSLLTQLHLVDYAELGSIDIERAFVKNCLNKMTSNAYDVPLRDLWRELIAVNPEIETVEDLFKVANSAMLMKASKGKRDYEICSLLPLSEKQIQIHYAQIAEKTGNELCPAIFNITTMESVITYSPTTNGLLFYFAFSLCMLSSLLTEKKLSSHARNQLGMFALSSNKSLPSSTAPPTLDL